MERASKASFLLWVNSFMRQYLFRGKSLETGEWVYGGITQCKIIETIEAFITSWEEDWQIISVDPSTVGQWTGLEDKNGVKIWEGDILEIFSSSFPRGVDFKGLDKLQRKGVIKYENSKACFEIDRSLDLGDAGGHSLQLFAEGYFEINTIGNIHDSPELLK